MPGPARGGGRHRYRPPHGRHVPVPIRARDGSVERHRRGADPATRRRRCSRRRRRPTRRAPGGAGRRARHGRGPRRRPRRACRSGVVAERIADPERPLDLVVNNAGFGTSGAFVTLDVDRLSDEIALNVDALTRLTHAALAVMVPRGRGWVLNVSSFASFQPAPRLAVYAATKAYVTSLGESLHEEVKGDGVGVTTLCPGLVRTEFQAVSNTSHYQSEFPELLWLPLAKSSRRRSTRRRSAARSSSPAPSTRAPAGPSASAPRGCVASPAAASSAPDRAPVPPAPARVRPGGWAGSSGIASAPVRSERVTPPGLAPAQRAERATMSSRRRSTPAAWRAGGGRRCDARCRCGCASRGSASSRRGRRSGRRRAADRR